MCFSVFRHLAARGRSGEGERGGKGTRKAVKYEATIGREQKGKRDAREGRKGITYRLSRESRSEEDGELQGLVNNLL